MRFRRLGAALLAFCLLAALMAHAAFAHVKPWYEWPNDPATGKPRRTLRVACAAGSSQELKDWLKDAAKNWNDANTGWTLEVTTDPSTANVTVQSGPLAANTLGECVSTFNAAGQVSGAAITLNSTKPWGTTGADNYDPVKVLKHELGHTMRLTHSAAGNLMPEALGKGDHNRTPNADDIAEAREAAGLPREVGDVRPKEGERAMELTNGNASLTVPEEDWLVLGGMCPEGVHLVPLDGSLLPGPSALPEGMTRIIGAAGVFPMELELIHHGLLELTIPAGVLDGSEGYDERHLDPRPPVDPHGLLPVRWDGNAWQPLPMPFHYNEAARVATVHIQGGGLYGFAAPELAEPAIVGRAAFTDLAPTLPALVTQSLTELKALDVYRGYPDGSGGPSRQLTRLEFFIIAVRVLGKEADAALLSSQRPAFSDDIPTWAWGYVNQAAALGLVKGYPDGSFKPSKEVSGNEAVTVAIRLMGATEEALAGPPKAWPQGYIDSARELGILSGLDELLGAGLTSWYGRAITRAEMAVLTATAIWGTVRHNADGTLTEGQSLAAAGGWWKQDVSPQYATTSFKYWILNYTILSDLGHRIVRLRLDPNLLLIPGVPCDATLLNKAVTAIGHNDRVTAILSVAP